MSFKRFDAEDIAISAESITSPVWSTEAPTLSLFYTSSAQYSTTNQYYVDVYQTGSTNTGAAVQFSLGYADKLGSGSLLLNSSVSGKSPSSIIYGQYRSLVLGDEDSEFVFGDYSAENFYVVSIDRARYKEKLLPATFNLTLTNGSEILSLTDNSRATTTLTFKDAGRVYQVVSGSNGVPQGGGTGYSVGSGSYGWFLPDIGTVLLNADALDETYANGGISLGTTRNSNTNDENVINLFDAIVDGASFQLNSEETVSSQYAFVRVRNSEFNYSVNPSNITGSGDLRHDVMVNAPQSYITTVGMYNDNNDLLAVAKLSQPLLKDFTKEALIRIKLDY